MTAKAPPAGWIIQVMEVVPDGSPAFLYFKVAIPDPVEAVGLTAKLVSYLPRSAVRPVAPLKSADIAGLEPGEVKPA
jgi:hypothetical protein